MITKQPKKHLESLRSIKLSRFTKPWLGPLVALTSLIILGAIGYGLTEGWEFSECLWMVLLTISTLGFGDIEPLTYGGRIVTVLIIGGGLVVVQITIKRALLLAESGYFHQVRELRFRRRMRRMQNHVIICGYGRIGQEIGEQLLKEGVEILVIENEPSRKASAEAKGLKVLLADATLDESLLMAGLNQCQSLVAALPSNAANLYVVLSAKSLRPDCRLIARAESEEAAYKLKLAGATAVVSPYIAAGRTMASTALRPLAVDFMDLLAGSNCEIEELRLTKDLNKFQRLKDRSLSGLELGRKSGAMVLAIRDGSDLITNPGGEIELSPGQLLVALGSKDQLSYLRRLLGEAIETYGSISS